MDTKGPGSPRQNDKKIELEYIYRQAVLLRGGSLVPPAKGCKFVERKRKEKKKSREENRKQHLERKREKKEKKSNRKQRRISIGGKQNSQAMIFP